MAASSSIELLRNFEALDDGLKQKVLDCADLIASEEGMVRDRRFRFKRYEACFVGSEVVSLLVERSLAETREEATQLLQYGLEANLYHHVVDEHEFEDAYLFYRLRQNDRPSLGPSVASLADSHFKSGRVRLKFNSKWKNKKNFSN